MRLTFIILIIGIIRIIFLVVHDDYWTAINNGLALYFVVENVIIRHVKTKREKLFGELTTDEIDVLKSRLKKAKQNV